MAKYTIDLSAAMNAAHAAVVRELEQVAAFARVGEAVAELPKDVELRTPNVTVGFGRAIDEAQSDFGGYCARYSVIGMVTACEIYLQRLLLLAKTAALVGTSGGVTGDRFEAMRDEWRAEIRASSPDGLLIKIGEAVGRDLRLPMLEWFRSICGVRRCLVHRGGLVQEEDLQSGDVLEATWRRTALVLNGDELGSVPFKAEKGGEVSLRLSRQTRRWRLGERVSLTAQDCQDICLTLAQFCGEVLKELNVGLAELLTHQRSSRRG